MGPSGPMGAVAGLFYILSILLVVGGLPKLVDPAPTGRALQETGLPAGPIAVRTLGLFEIIIGVAAVLLGGSLLAVAVGASYLAFAGYIWYVMANPQRGAGCGCLGEAEKPPTRVHLIGDLFASGVGLMAAAVGVVGLPAAVSAQPVGGIPFLAFVGLGSWFLFLVFTELPVSLIREGT